MYFNSENNFYHGIMFHHFHDNKLHKKGQGSIDKEDFYKIIKFIGRKNILNSLDFFNRFKEKKLKEKDVCFTFDDGIRCQYDIALPIMEDFQIKSFFFVYSSLLDKEPDMLEIYRYFRMNFFKNIDDFYKEYFENLDKDLKIFFKNQENKINETKKKFPHYSINDIKFRLTRDSLLAPAEYKKAMLRMFDKHKFDHKEYHKILFLSPEHLKKLKKLGHLIGLHSHSHPTVIENMSYNEQLEQYEKNISILSNVLKIKKNEIKFMSHPNGSYNQNTIKILKDLGIEIGFKQIMTIEPEKGMKKINNSFLEIARQDHAAIIKMMHK
tara:strand:- start:268 stop:1239 length:972 start_codon:yes stop_codon:yes gene_type:complete